MRTLSSNEIRKVAGGDFTVDASNVYDDAISQRELDDILDDGGNDSDSYVGNRPVINADDWGGKYSGALSLAGSRFGFPGAVAGYVAGSVIDMTNFENLGENYKDNIMNELRNGNIPAD